jgi:AraC-like DNA-binding protein
VRCHLVIKGGTFLKVANAATPISLQRGDFVLLPRGSDFTLQDAPGSPIYFGDPARDIAIRLGRIPLIQWGGGGESTILMFGRFELDTIAAKFLQTLPDVIHIPSEDGALPHWAGPLCSADALLRSTSGPGAETVMCRFAEMCIAAGVRNFLASPAAAEQRLTFGVPKLNRVVRRIHENPGQRWSVSCLAQEAGMSRAAFALAFREAFGEPPMHYLTGVRMARASEMLRNKALSLQDVSFQLGYESEVSFSRAFKRHWAISPGACRRKHQGHV